MWNWTIYHRNRRVGFEVPVGVVPCETYFSINPESVDQHFSKTEMHRTE